MDFTLDRVLGIIGAIGIPTALGMGLGMDPKTLGELRFAQACLCVAAAAAATFTIMWGVSTDASTFRKWATVAILLACAGIALVEGIGWAQRRHGQDQPETPLSSPSQAKTAALVQEYRNASQA